MKQGEEGSFHPGDPRDEQKVKHDMRCGWTRKPCRELPGRRDLLLCPIDGEDSRVSKAGRSTSGMSENN